MPKISIDKLKPGMRIASPVLNHNGMILLSEDTALTDVMIAKLKNIDVESVYVKVLSKPEKRKEEALFDLDKRFEKIEDKPYMGTLKKVLKEHIEGLYDKA